MTLQHRLYPEDTWSLRTTFSKNTFGELLRVFQLFKQIALKISGTTKKYFLQGNFKEFIYFTPACCIHGNPIVVHAKKHFCSCTWSRSCRLCHRINHWGWAVWWKDQNFFCKDDPSKNKSSRNRNNIPIICWKFICSNENVTYIDFFN